MEIGRKKSDRDNIYFAGDAIDYCESFGVKLSPDRKRIGELEDKLGICLINNSSCNYDKFGAIFNEKIVYLDDISHYFENNKLELGNPEHIRLNDIFEYLKLANENFEFIVSNYTSCMRDDTEDDD